MLDTKEKLVYTLDLYFLGIPGTIASYLIPHPRGAVLVECGPGSTLEGLTAGLKAHGFTPADVTDVLLTHIHLDHGGAAGWMARQGARIHVHPAGAPHLLNPEKLLASAQRIYGEQMQRLWGDFLPVPEDRLNVVEDGQVLEIEGLVFQALDTPGHANHHHAYLLGNLCFSGDIAGVRLANTNHVRLPMPPPDLNLEKWRLSLSRLQATGASRIAPTHFGLYTDTDWHLAAALKALDEIEAWVEATMPTDPSPEDLSSEFQEWTRRQSLQEGLDERLLPAYEAVNPAWMSSQGLYRYWRKVRMGL
jgi:glyoxylase-like metal-dependent hydrolase (beta-lactamase superfamily II)